MIALGNASNGINPTQSYSPVQPGAGSQPSPLSRIGTSPGAILGGASAGRFKPEMTTLGDFDRDGVPDGAVLLIHRDDDGGSSHHLLAYLFDGNTFRPVARLNLESYYQNVASVTLGEIADGGIELLLHTRRAGDPACCPSGRRNATFELRDGQFVLVAESDSGA